MRRILLILTAAGPDGGRPRLAMPAAALAAGAGAAFPFFWGTSVYGWLEVVAVGTPVVWLLLVGLPVDLGTVERWQPTGGQG
jgi:hypothetical protein